MRRNKDWDNVISGQEAGTWQGRARNFSFTKKAQNSRELQRMANVDTKNTRRKLRPQHKHINQILGFILREKSNRELTLRHKSRKNNQSSFVISVAKNSVRRKVWVTTRIWLYIIRRWTILLKNWQNRERKTHRKTGMNIDRNRNFFIRTNKGRFTTLSPQNCRGFMYPRRSSIVWLAF